MATKERPTAPDWDQTDLAILGLLADGNTVETVARKVGLSGRTVRRRLRVLADDAGVETTMQTVVHAVRAGLI